MDPKASFDIGIGPTPELGLRVSVASLARVLFKKPDDSEWMLALERKASLVEIENTSIIEVIAQPFGGAVRILDLQALYKKVGNFHFDSHRSRAEADFRLFIQPSVWPALREFLIEHLSREEDPVLETEPDRELVEEFEDALQIKLTPNQYVSRPVGIILEENSSPTENYRARDYPTVRVYRIFESSISDLTLAGTILTSSNRFSDRDLSDLALNKARNGGQGRANGILALPVEAMMAFYSGMKLQNRNNPVLFEGHRLAETVAAVLGEIEVPKYQRL